MLILHVPSLPELINLLCLCHCLVLAVLLLLLLLLAIKQAMARTH